MKKHIKYLLLILVIPVSLACSLPFLAGDSTSTESASTEASEANTPLPPTPETSETSETEAACLAGNWVMDTYALNNKFLDLTLSSTMYVVAPSALSLEFRMDGTYNIGGDTTIRFDIPGTTDYMQMNALHSGQGNFAADETTISFTNGQYDIVYGNMIMVIDGESAEILVTPSPLPDDYMSPPGSATYQCSEHSLMITYDGPSGPITEEWSR